MNKKLKIGLTSITAVLCVYTITGFFLIPVLGKNILIKEIKQNHELNLSIENIYLNPFTFHAAITNVTLKKHSDTLAKFKSLEANLNPVNLLRKNVDFSYIIFEKLKLYPTLQKNGNLNIFEIFDTKQEQNTAEKQNKSEFIFQIANFELKNSYLYFSDFSKDKFYQAEFGPLNHTFKNLSTKAKQESTHSSDFDLNEYGFLNVDAKVVINPFSIQAKIEHENLNLTNVDYFIEDEKYSFDEGILSYSTDINFFTNPKAKLTINNFTSHIDNLSFLHGDKKTLKAKSSTVSLSGLNYDFKKKNISIDTTIARLKSASIYDNFIANTIHHFNDINATINGFDLEKDFDGALFATFEDTQHVELHTTANFQSKSANLQAMLKNIDLTNYNTYLNKYVNIALQQGLLQLDLDLAYLLENNASKVHATSNLLVNDLHLVNTQKKDLVKVESVTVENGEFSLNENSLKVVNITVKAPRLFFKQNNKKSNFSNLVKGSVQDINETDTNTKEPLNFMLEKLSIQQGTLEIDDIEKITMDDINVNATNIAPNENATLSLSAVFDKYSGIEANAVINTFDFTQNTVLKGKVSAFNLPSISAYAKKSIGREIRRGKFSDTFEIKINDSILDSVHNVVINNIEVSDHISDTNTTVLPINLAIALLQDRNKVIDLNIDIENDLNSPDFKARNLVLTVLSNVITKTVSSPFSLIGSLVGLSGEELSKLEFEYGKAQLDQNMLSKLDAILKILRQRPELNLQICPSYDAQDDVKALKEQRLEKLLLENSLKKLLANYEINTKQEDEQKLKEMLLSKIKLNEEALKALAKSRADFIYQYFMSAYPNNTQIQICENINDSSNVTEFKLDAKP